MSIPGSIPRTAASAPEQTESKRSRTRPPASPRANAASPPVMTCKSERKAEKELREIYSSLPRVQHNDYLDQIILNKKSACSSSSRGEGKSSPPIDVDSQDFEYEGENLYLVAELLDKKAYGALGLLLRRCPKIASEREIDSEAYIINLFVDHLTQQNVYDLINALNTSPHPLSAFFHPISSKKRGQDHLLHILKCCNTITSLKVSVTGDSDLSAWAQNRKIMQRMQEDKKIKHLYISCFTKDDPEQPSIKQLLSLLSDMPWLETFHFEPSLCRRVPVITSRILESLKSAQNLRSLTCAPDVFYDAAAREDFIELIRNLPNLSDLILYLDIPWDEDAELAAIEKLRPAIAACKSLNSLKLHYCGYSRDVEPFLEMVFSCKSITHLDLGHPSKFRLDTLQYLKQQLMIRPNIVQIFGNDEGNEFYKKYNARIYPFENTEYRAVFLEIFTLLDKNRARAALAEKFGTSFSQYRDGNQMVDLSGPAYLPQDVGNLIAENILDLSPSAGEFDRVMSLVNRSAWEAELQNKAHAGTNGIGNSGGPMRTTSDVVTLTTTSTTTTTTTTTTTPASGSPSSPSLQSTNSTASSAAAAEGAMPTQPADAGQTTAPPGGTIDTGYESDVFIESSDDEE